MLTASETLYLSVNIQLLLTVFLVVLLWALYARLRRFEFFRWWAWAWTAFAVYLGTAAISLRVGPAWTPLKACLVFVLLLSGFLEVALLVFGGLSWRAPHKLARRVFWTGIGLAVVAAWGCFILGFYWRSIPVASMAVRNLTRTFALALALLFCVEVFWRQFRLNRSLAAAITGTFCFAYAIDQFLYFLAFAEVVSRFWSVPFPPMLPRVNLPATDTVPPFMTNVPSASKFKPIDRSCPKLTDAPFSTTITALLLLPMMVALSAPQARMPVLVTISVPPGPLSPMTT